MDSMSPASSPSLTPALTPALVVIGAGHAGAEAAVAVRQGGYTGTITLVGDEASLPYHRPPLSKAYLHGEATAESLLLKPGTAYEKADVTLRLGARATGIERERKSVMLANGDQLPYTQLIVATGSRARHLHAPGLTEGVRPSNLFYLRTIDDVEAMRAHFTSGQRLVIIGAGYIGLEVASVARKCGLDVTVLEAAERVLARVTAAEVSAFYAGLHAQAGVDVRVATKIEHVELDDAGAIVSLLTNHGSVAADLVIAGIGVLPNQELAAEAGLAIDNGIMTDEFMRTSDPDIFAIGDCSNHPSQVYGRRIRLESVPNALEQARCVASVINGAPKPYVSVPWFWSEQYDLKLQMAGLSQGFDKVVVRGAPATKSFAVFYLREGAIISADCVNQPTNFMAMKKLVGARAVVAGELLADESVPLKEIVAASVAA
jgi:3-phenylpropionate/trans-cinnamate dioxygenase ferredoxin reductase subunit